VVEVALEGGLGARVSHLAGLEICGLIEGALSLRHRRGVGARMVSTWPMQRVLQNAVATVILQHVGRIVRSKYNVSSWGV
jgi:hypothetical protein